MIGIGMSENSGWIDLCDVSQVPLTGGAYVTAGNRALAVFRDGQAVVVLDDACPHAGGSLSAGGIDDGCVICPWHGWAFELSSGQCPDNRQIAVRRHEARVVAGRVQVRLAASGN
jgi:nitrite reductase (NADH) small subunit